jgi:hypothetical protein
LGLLRNTIKGEPFFLASRSSRNLCVLGIGVCWSPHPRLVLVLTSSSSGSCPRLVLVLFLSLSCPRSRLDPSPLDPLLVSLRHRTYAGRCCSGRPALVVTIIDRQDGGTKCSYGGRCDSANRKSSAMSHDNGYGVLVAGNSYIAQS